MNTFVRLLKSVSRAVGEDDDFFGGTEEATTQHDYCAREANACPDPNAGCVNYATGFCCRCQGDYFGNGTVCLQNGMFAMHSVCITCCGICVFLYVSRNAEVLWKISLIFVRVDVAWKFQADTNTFYRIKVCNESWLFHMLIRFWNVVKTAKC